jgi:hypothetical protein
MWRYLLILSLSLTTLLGPSLCCCTLGRVLAMASGAASQECCRGGDEAGKGDCPANAPHDCPCKKTRNVAAFSDRASLPPVPVHSTGWMLHDWPVDSTVTNAVRVTQHFSARDQSLFLPSGVDLIYALCAMRC